MNLQFFRELVAAEIKNLVDCPANYVTLDAPDRAWVDRCLIFSKGLRMWHETNCVVFGKRWRENDQGLLTIFVPEFHWRTELRDLHRREWPRKPVGVRPYDPAYHSWYITKQVTWCNMPFDSLGVFTNCPRFSDKRFPRVSECNLKRVFAKEVERLNSRPNKVPLFNWDSFSRG